MVLVGQKAQGGRSEGRREGEWASGEKSEGEEGDAEKGREGEGEKEELQVTRLKFKTGMISGHCCFCCFIGIMWLVLSELTDSPVPVRDSFITSLVDYCNMDACKKNL